MTIFSQELEERNLTDATATRWLRQADVLNVAWKLKSVKIIIPSSPRYGATRNDRLFQRGILKENETIEYTFLNEKGDEKIFETKSITFYIAIRRANLTEDETFKVIKEGNGTSTRYYVNKITTPEPAEEA
jgi:hypothetical protein